MRPVVVRPRNPISSLWQGLAHKARHLVKNRPTDAVCLGLLVYSVIGGYLQFALFMPTRVTLPLMVGASADVTLFRLHPQELEINRRSRSAKLRIIEKL